ncbi:MAG: hypothetical protein UV36_C0008G0009 [Parcubacteria group bacterium GW2011_GWC2_42_6]|nr:MAG: hypothetical protein UV36_C0008G0009 [Parcubacteria group bacterium GW2011_GWC2_42_6]KKT76732.1 MAG: hypothetical protein UW72_C0002G0034 [Parcubacteria group bacterium GW2011_GWF2_44_7]
MKTIVNVLLVAGFISILAAMFIGIFLFIIENAAREFLYILKS